MVPRHKRVFELHKPRNTPQKVGGSVRSGEFHARKTNA